MGAWGTWLGFLLPIVILSFILPNASEDESMAVWVFLIVFGGFMILNWIQLYNQGFCKVARAKALDTGYSTDILRVLRGGSFDYTAGSLRSAIRGYNHPNVDEPGNGFRCARSYGSDS